MHIKKEHILEISKEGANLTAEERQHFRDCEACTDLFRFSYFRRVTCRQQVSA
jgi:hypothetical protein